MPLGLRGAFFASYPLDPTLGLLGLSLAGLKWMPVDLVQLSKLMDEVGDRPEKLSQD